MDSLTDLKLLSDTVARILDIGELLLSNGATVNRVEDTINRLCAAFHFKRSDVHAINSSIVLSVTTQEGDVETQARRINKISTNLNIVAECNHLSRMVCGEETGIDWISAEIERIRQVKPFHPAVIYLGYAVASSAFTLFFGGNLYDFAVSVGIALLIRLGQRRLAYYNTNKMVENILLSAMLTLLTEILCMVFPQLNSDIVIIGNIMLLIPGLAFCNGIRDMVMGDTISGALTLLDALMRALSIAIGYAGVWTIFGRLL